VVKVSVLDDYTGWVKGYAGWRTLAGEVEVSCFSDHLAKEDELAERLADSDIVVLERERTPFPGSLMRRLPKLKLIACTGPVNWTVDLETARELGITVSCTRSSYDETPELTWSLLLSLARRTNFEEAALRQGQWQTGIGRRVAGKRLGLVGLGNVGRRVADFGNCFNMDVVAWSQNLTAERAADGGAKLVGFDELLETSDYVSIHVVLSERTRNLFGAREFGLMKYTAALINTSRAPIIDNDALLAALDGGQIAAAALDVFPVEPLPADSPMRAARNLILTPHIGYVTEEQYEVFYADVVENIGNFIGGRPIRPLVMD
jgi:phosphoglycerate dehydrogenase-like enzyme